MTALVPWVKQHKTPVVVGIGSMVVVAVSLWILLHVPRSRPLVSYEYSLKRAEQIKANNRPVKEKGKSASNWKLGTPSIETIQTFAAKLGFSRPTGSFFKQWLAAQRTAVLAQQSRGYELGGKGLLGGIDCSGFVYLVRRMTEVLLGQTYGMPWNDDTKAHGSFFPMTSAAFEPVATTTHKGGPWNGRNLMPGDVLSIAPKKTPDFAQGRPYGISHIVLTFVDADGVLCVAESGGPYAGTGYMPAEHWLRRAASEQYTVFAFQAPEMKVVWAKAGGRPKGEWA